MTAAEVDINNLDAFNQVEEIDPNASISDQAPPPPAGTYQLRLKLAQGAVTDDKKLVSPDRFPAKNVSSFQTQTGPKLMIVIEQEIVSDNGRRYQTQRDYASTMVLDSVKTSAVDTYLKVLTGRAGVGMTQAQKVQTLYDLLATEPVCQAEIEWSGRVETDELDKKGKKVWKTAKLDGKSLSRMANFPSVEINGQTLYKPADVDDDGREVVTRWEVRRLLPLQ